MPWHEEPCEDPGVAGLEELYAEFKPDVPSVEELPWVTWFIDPASGQKYKRLRESKRVKAHTMWIKWHDRWHDR